MSVATLRGYSAMFHSAWTLGRSTMVIIWCNLQAEGKQKVYTQVYDGFKVCFRNTW